jgi:hypothetical protein
MLDSRFLKHQLLRTPTTRARLNINAENTLPNQKAKLASFSFDLSHLASELVLTHPVTP